MFVRYEHSPDRWVFRLYCANGSFYKGMPCGDDLINSPPKKIRKEGWVNIYPYKCSSSFMSRIAHTGGIHKTRKLADEACLRANKNGIPLPVATIKIEWEEEQ